MCVNRERAELLLLFIPTFAALPIETFKGNDNKHWVKSYSHNKELCILCTACKK